MANIAVVGAGLSGLVVATNLSKQHSVVVFDKSRGAGGRMATRYADDYEFDHGAPYFAAHTPKFKAFLQPLINSGVVSSVHARVADFSTAKAVTFSELSANAEHYAGTPRMNAVGKHLASRLNIHYGVTVTLLNSCDAGWQLFDQHADTLGIFDWIILALPQAQTADLIPSGIPLLQQHTPNLMQPCYTLMLGFKNPLSLDWDIAKPSNSSLSSVVVNSNKPGRPDRYTVVAHSSCGYAERRLDEDKTAVANELLLRTAEVLEKDYRPPEFMQLHRWLYATCNSRTGASFYTNRDACLAACGDWISDAGVEGAFTSATQLSETLLHVV